MKLLLSMSTNGHHPTEPVPDLNDSEPIPAIFPEVSEDTNNSSTPAEKPNNKIEKKAAKGKTVIFPSKFL